MINIEEGVGVSELENKEVVLDVEQVSFRVAAEILGMKSQDRVKRWCGKGRDTYRIISPVKINNKTYLSIENIQDLYHVLTVSNGMVRANMRNLSDEYIAEKQFKREVCSGEKWDEVVERARGYGMEIRFQDVIEEEKKKNEQMSTPESPMNDED